MWVSIAAQIKLSLYYEEKVLYCIEYRYLYSASHSINQTEVLLSAIQLQEKG